MGAGRLRERVTIQTAVPRSLSVTSLVRSGTTATATTAEPHGYTTGDWVIVSGASPAGYNGRVKVTVTGTLTFTFSVDGALTTPAAGAIQTTYQADAQGGRAETWRDVVVDLPAELVPLRGLEQLQAAAVRSEVSVRFRIYARTDVAAQMRALWRPSWPVGATVQTFEIHAPTRDPQAPHVFMLLDCSQIQVAAA